MSPTLNYTLPGGQSMPIWFTITRKQKSHCFVLGAPSYPPPLEALGTTSYLLPLPPRTLGIGFELLLPKSSGQRKAGECSQLTGGSGQHADLQGLSQDQSCLSETFIRTRGTMLPTGSRLTSTILELRRQVLTGCCQGGRRGNGVYGQLHSQLQFGEK